MASRAELETDVADWLNRQDFGARIGRWIAMAELDIAELLRARCMLTRATQVIDAPSITLPVNFLEMDSITDSTTGKLLDLEDHWTGPLSGSPVTAFRLRGNCVEFLPPPLLTDTGQFQSVTMSWYAAPDPLVDPQDTNVVLEKLYQVYLFGVCRYAAKWALDPERAQQAEQDLTESIGAANEWKRKTDFAGAPLRAVVNFWR